MRDQLLGGRYRLVRQIGEGGMGEVWEAQDESLCRPVAVKLISLLAGGGDRGDEARARFLREARITARLQHPNIVTIHDLGETGAGRDRAPFLVMELVRGEGLDEKLRRGPVTLTEAAVWGAQIGDALSCAHDAGVLHRDIKPSNVLITSSGTVKVLDFGVARAADPSATAITRTGVVVGTPLYMAPEQARGFPEPSSDLYALGCLIFELITGRPPFQAPDTMGYLSAHLTQDPPTLSSVSTGIPPVWDVFMLTLLHKDPNRRYPNAADLSHALRHMAATGPLGPFEIGTFAGTCLDVLGGSTEDGVPVIQHRSHGGSNQRFYLVPVGSNPGSAGDSPPWSTQADWTWCNKCQGLWFRPHASSSKCPQGDEHSAAGSSDYVLAFDASPTPAGHQPGWCWCSKCQGLWFGPNLNQSVCPQGGTHSRAGSGNYHLPTQ